MGKRRQDTNVRCREPVAVHRRRSRSVCQCRGGHHIDFGLQIPRKSGSGGGHIHHEDDGWREDDLRRRSAGRQQECAVGRCSTPVRTERGLSPWAVSCAYYGLRSSARGSRRIAGVGPWCREQTVGQVAVDAARRCIMQNRREFVKEMVAGAAALGTSTKFALGQTRTTEKSKVVIVRDAKLRTPGPSPDEKRVAAMLDHAMQTYFNAQNPVQPWKQLVRPGQVVGLKLNCLGRALSPNVALVAAICERLQQAGIKPGDIIVWDSHSRNLPAAGFKLSTDPGSVRYTGSDATGFETAAVSYGVVTTRLAKIRSDE